MAASQVVLIDRSRMVSYMICPRLRFLTYHLGGRGLVPTGNRYPLDFGSVYHEALENLTKQATTEPTWDQRMILTEASDRLSAIIEATPPERWPNSDWIREQRYLLEGLLWAWVTVKLPEMLRDYDVVSTEREFLWTLGTADGLTIVDMVRLDALIRDRVTDALYYKEYKTTAWGNDQWASEFEHNGQVLANLSALDEGLGERASGVLIEGHVKGPTRRDTARSSQMAGQLIQDSPFCYAFQKGLGDIRTDWAYGYRRTPIQDLGFTPFQWVTEYLGDIVRTQFIQLAPIDPDPAHTARWRRQTLARETRIAQALRVIQDPDTAADRRTQVLDEVFPLHEASCIRYGRKCSHYEICHNPTTAAEPLASPDFEPRVPHHQAEADLLGADPEKDS